MCVSVVRVCVLVKVVNDPVYVVCVPVDVVRVPVYVVPVIVV